MQSLKEILIVLFISDFNKASPKGFLTVDHLQELPLHQLI